MGSKSQAERYRKDDGAVMGKKTQMTVMGMEKKMTMMGKKEKSYAFYFYFFWKKNNFNL